MTAKIILGIAAGALWTAGAGAQEVGATDTTVDQPAGGSEALDVEGAAGAPVGPGTASFMFDIGLTLGVRAQVGFSQVFSDLGVAPAGELEVGYRLPWLGRRIGVFVAGGYQYTYASGSGEDVRLVDAGGTPYPDGWTWDLGEHAAIVTLGILGRLFGDEDAFSPYVWIGPRVYFLETVIDGDAGGAAFGENTETSTEFGVAGGIGVEYHLGPGPLFAEVEVGWSPLRHDVTGDASTGQLGLAFGYRVQL